VLGHFFDSRHTPILEGVMGAISLHNRINPKKLDRQKLVDRDDQTGAVVFMGAILVVLDACPR
jgi:hypothetical protein